MGGKGLAPALIGEPGRVLDAFRRRVDEALRRALIDDDCDLLCESKSPRVVELSPFPERQLDELIQLTTGRAPGQHAARE